ncbi:hypothetical protein OG21DRAFT_1466738, partial [Imleria badia]
TGHCPLNSHLHRIKRSPSPHCASCPDEIETVRHYLLDCPQFARERSLLTRSLRKSTLDIPFLVSDTAATTAVLNFINATKRFHASLGDVPPNDLTLPPEQCQSLTPKTRPPKQLPRLTNTR